MAIREVGTPDIENPTVQVDRQEANLRFFGPTVVVLLRAEKRSLDESAQGILGRFSV